MKLKLFAFLKLTKNDKGKFTRKKTTIGQVGFDIKNQIPNFDILYDMDRYHISQKLVSLDLVLKFDFELERANSNKSFEGLMNIHKGKKTVITNISKILLL